LAVLSAANNEGGGVNLYLSFVYSSASIAI
jgi:hypothetical protein